MRKNLRLNALTRLAKVNEAVAVDIKKLKKNGINTESFIKNVEMSNIPYTVNENYNILLLNDVVYSDVLESLRDLGVKRNLLAESVANGISKNVKSLNEWGELDKTSYGYNIDKNAVRGNEMLYDMSYVLPADIARRLGAQVARHILLVKNTPTDEMLKYNISPRVNAYNMALFNSLKYLITERDIKRRGGRFSFVVDELEDPILRVLYVISNIIGGTEYNIDSMVKICAKHLSVNAIVKGFEEMKDNFDDDKLNTSVEIRKFLTYIVKMCVEISSFGDAMRSLNQDFEDQVLSIGNWKSKYRPYSKTSIAMDPSLAESVAIRRAVKKALLESKKALNDCDDPACKRSKRRRSLKKEDSMDEALDFGNEFEIDNISGKEIIPTRFPDYNMERIIYGALDALGLGDDRSQEDFLERNGIKNIDSLMGYLFNTRRLRDYAEASSRGAKSEYLTWVCTIVYLIRKNAANSDYVTKLVRNTLVAPIASALKKELERKTDISNEDIKNVQNLMKRVVGKFYEVVLDPESTFITPDVITRVLRITKGSAKYSWLYANESVRPFERKALPAMRRKGMSVNEASQLGEELLSKQELEKAQKQVDEIIEELKNEELDKKTAKKATTRLKKVKGLRRLKRVKHLINKLSKQYPEAKNLLTESVVGKVVDAIESKRNYLNENMTINGNHISTYSLRELKECCSKVNKNVKALQSKIKQVSLNESYTAKDVRGLKEELKKQMALYYMLNEEISWKHMILAAGGFNAVSLNESDDEKDSKKDSDDMGTSLDDLFNNIGDEIDTADNDSNDDDKEEPKDKESDNDTAELDSVTITMTSEDAANGLKDTLVEKGVPEDVIEVEEAESESGETNESVSYSKKFLRLFEDDEPETDGADNSEESDETEDDSDNSDDSNEDKQYNVTLTDTDYINTLKDVMVDEYGYNEDEFWDSIGGKPVDDEDDSDDDSKDGNKSDDDKDNEDTSELDSIGADIFGDE